MEINICGIPYKIIERKDHFDTDLQFAMVDHKKCEIVVNDELTEEGKKESICHEFVHAVLLHLGYNEMHNDEQFVQALGNAIYQTFGRSLCIIAQRQQ